MGQHAKQIREGDAAKNQMKRKITLYLEKEVLKRFKHRCVEEDKTYSRKLEELLKELV